MYIVMPFGRFYSLCGLHLFNIFTSFRDVCVQRLKMSHLQNNESYGNMDHIICDYLA